MVHTLPSPKTKNKRTRVGRGFGSGHGGHTAGRGTKGQKSRSGYKIPRPGFEGGQMPLSRQLPKLRGLGQKRQGNKRGYYTANRKHFNLQLSEVAAQISDGKVNWLSLLEAGVIEATTKKVSAKILFDQDVDKKLEVESIPVSTAAKQAIEKAGGKVIN